MACWREDRCGCFLFHEIPCYSRSKSVLNCLFCFLCLSNHVSTWVLGYYSFGLLPNGLLVNSVQLPRGQPKRSLSEAELTCLPKWIASLSLQVLLSPSLDSCSNWQPPRSSLRFPVWYSGTTMFPSWHSSFPGHSLYLGPAWPLPQTPYIFAPLFFDSPRLLPGVFFLFHLKCKVLFKYCFHHEVFLILLD